MTKAKTRQGNDRGGYRRYEKPTIVEHTLTPGMADGFFRWLDGVEDAWVLIHEMLERGYRVTIKPDFDSKRVQCTCTQLLSDRPNADHLLISFAPTPEKAVLLSYYKTFVLIEHEYWSELADLCAAESRGIG